MPSRDTNDIWTFPFCPAPPSWSLDWSVLVEQFEWLRAMEGCPQDSQWHAEGDVLTHTRMTCEVLIEMPSWRSLSVEERSALFAATLMHDIAKPKVTCEGDGRIRSPRHASKGCRMVRCYLLQGLLPTMSEQRLALRETVCALVRHHGLPLYHLDSSDPVREILAASQVVRLDWLAIVARADALGRECPDKRELLDRIELFRQACNEQGCIAEPRAFPSDHTRFLYFSGRRADPDVEVYDDTRLEVVLMSGLPACGKDCWMDAEGPAWPCISLDNVRDEMQISPSERQGNVVQKAREMARTFLRDGQPFIWNATNTTSPMRRQLIRFFHEYRARVRVVYTETSWPAMLERNRKRPKPVPEFVLQKLIGELDVPNLTEAHAVEYVVS